MPAGPQKQTLGNSAEPRIEEILDQARAAFVEKGFDGASMQDLARAAGMSAGNFYRYFPSKAAIVEALVGRDLDEVEQEFQRVVSAVDPLAALRIGLRARLDEDCSDKEPLWAEIMAAATRKPEIAAALDRMETKICRMLVRVFAKAAGLTDQAATDRFGAHARFLIMLVRGMSMEMDKAALMKSDLKRLVERTIDNVIDEVTQARFREI